MSQRDCYASVSIGGSLANVLYDQGGVEVTEDFNAACTRFSITTNTSGFEVNDEVDIVMGFVDDNATFINGGFVDSVTAERPPGVYRIEGRDKLKKAVDFFIVAASLDDADFFNPRLDNGSTTPHDIVDDILAECGLTGLDFWSGGGGWTIGNAEDGTPFQLVSAWDAIQQVSEIGVWKVWAHPNGNIEFAQVLTDPGAPSGALTTGNDGNILSCSYSRSDDDLRNKVVAIGENGDYISTASAVSPFLPEGFYKTAVVSTDLIGSQAMADDSAAINLTRFNKLTERVDFEAEGNPNIHVQSTLTITEAFVGIAGDWFVYEVTHTIDGGGYKMRGTGVK